jgi:hypothetical protein
MSNYQLMNKSNLFTHVGDAVVQQKEDAPLLLQESPHYGSISILTTHSITGKSITIHP